MTVPDALVTTFVELTFTFDSQMEGVVQSTISAFAQFPAEASIIGRLLAATLILKLQCSIAHRSFETISTRRSRSCSARYGGYQQPRGLRDCARPGDDSGAVSNTDQAV
jgi:hypothetical protein